MPLVPTLSASVASAENAARLNVAMLQENEWRLKANSLFELHRLVRSGELIPQDLSPADIPLKITKKPPIRSPSFGRGQNVDLDIKLLVVFQADGKVRVAIPIQYPKNGFPLILEVIAAVLQIEFEPAVKNGKQYTVMKTLEYTFSRH